MERAKEKGVALILTMIMVAVLSIITVSLMFLSQSETWSSMNFRLMSQSRDAAEAGLNVTANVLMGYPQASGFVYAPPATANATDPIVNYDITVSPVRVLATGAPVGLVATGSDAPALSYPVGSVQNDFDTASHGYVRVGYNTNEARNARINYAAYAELLSMREVIPYGRTTPQTIQTWRITSRGMVGGVQNASVEVSAVLDRPVAPMFAYAAFGESLNCGALNWGGSTSQTGSYDSSTVTPPTPPTMDTFGGNVGTNGNLTQAGNTTINGTLSTPRSGVGSCTSGNVTALDVNGGATVTGGLVELPQAIDYPDPDAPDPVPPTNNQSLTNNASCLALAPACTPVVAGAEYRLTPTCTPAQPVCGALGTTTYGNLSIGANKIVHLCPGTYNMNSISMGGNAQIIIDPPGGACAAGDPTVILNIAGRSIAANQYVVDFGGGTLSNPSFDPSRFQIMYAGTSDIRLTGSSATAGLVNAPNGDVIFSGGGTWYGAVIGETVTNLGGANLIYDRRLARTLYTISPYMLHAFTWKKF